MKVNLTKENFSKQQLKKLYSNKTLDIKEIYLTKFDYAPALFDIISLQNDKDFKRYVLRKNCYLNKNYVNYYENLYTKFIKKIKAFIGYFSESDFLDTHYSYRRIVKYCKEFGNKYNIEAPEEMDDSKIYTIEDKKTYCRNLITFKTDHFKLSKSSYIEISKTLSKISNIILERNLFSEYDTKLESKKIFYKELDSYVIIKENFCCMQEKAINIISRAIRSNHINLEDIIFKKYVKIQYMKTTKKFI
jgi:hypothetical protein